MLQKLNFAPGFNKQVTATGGEGQWVSGVTTMFVGYDASFVYGLFIIVSGCIGARIWCELLIVLFKIHSNLQKIASKE